MALAGAAGAATLYRFGPSREQADWVWLTPGSAFAAIGWLLLTIGFGLYVAHFGNYNATYGSLGAVVVLLTWLYLSCYILVFGAELNSEFERQTQPRPSGADVNHDIETVETVRTELSDLHRGALHDQDIKGFGTARLTAIATRFTGAGKIGLVTSGMSTVGFARIRKGRMAQGVALLGAASLLALLQGRRNGYSK